MATTQGPVIAALETTFTPPAACFTTLEAYIDRNTVLLVPLGITATQTDSGCWPPGYAQFQSTYTGSAQGYFSPGVCPSGFTSACAVAAATGPESAALCCPRSVSRTYPRIFFLFIFANDNAGTEATRAHPGLRESTRACPAKAP